jgi:hypothetical protein
MTLMSYTTSTFATFISPTKPSVGQNQAYTLQLADPNFIKYNLFVSIESDWNTPPAAYSYIHSCFTFSYRQSPHFPLKYNTVTLIWPAQKRLSIMDEISIGSWDHSPSLPIPLDILFDVIQHLPIQSILVLRQVCAPVWVSWDFRSDLYLPD